MNARLGSSHRLVHAALCAGSFYALGSCTDADSPGDRPQCVAVDPVDMNCLPLYEPVFVEIFQRTLNGTCASSGVSCHGADGRMGGVTFVNLSESYETLLGRNGGTRRVIPGDAACSELVVRLDSPAKDWSMPPGAPLDERARCAIRRWIGAGAPPPSLDGGQ